MKKKQKNPNAVALGSKGGKARAKNLSADDLSSIGKKGAKARFENVTEAQRAQIASNAALARWAKTRKLEGK